LYGQASLSWKYPVPTVGLPYPASTRAWPVPLPVKSTATLAIRCS
jgi:hypothetical protein